MAVVVAAMMSSREGSGYVSSASGVVLTPRCCVAAVLLLCCCCVAVGAFCVSRCYEEFRSALEHARRLDLDPRKEPLVAEAKRLFESVKDRIEVRRVPLCVSCTTRTVAYAVHALADSRCTPPPVGGEPSPASLVVLPAPELCFAHDFLMVSSLFYF